MATLSGNKIKNTYQALVKFSDNGNITTSAKQLTDGFGNNSPIWVSTTQVGIGVTPESGLNLHVYGDAKIGSNLTVIGNLVVEGSTTTVGTDTLTVKDPLIVLANNNTSTDAVDIGFYGKYTPSGTTLYSGLFREALTGKYRLFKGLETEPTTTVNTSGTGYTAADLVIGNLQTNGLLEESTQFKLTKDIRIFDSIPAITLQDSDSSGSASLGDIQWLDNAASQRAVISLNNAILGITSKHGGLSFATNSTPALTIDGSQNAIFNSNLDITGDLAVNTDKFTVNAANGNTLVAGTLGVTSTLTSADITTGNISAGNGIFSGGITANGTSVTNTFKSTVLINRVGQVSSLLIGSNSLDDVLIGFQTDGNSMSMGIDRSDGNAFKISDSNGSLGTDDRFKIDTTGDAFFTGLVSGITPTAAANFVTKDYVDSNITAQDLDFSGTSGTGSVDLDSQTFAVIGTANEIETSAGSQQLQIGLPNDVTIARDLTVVREIQTFSLDVTAGASIEGLAVTGDSTFSGTVTAPTFIGDLNGTINTLTTAVTQSANNNSTKVATTAYVDTSAGLYLPLIGGVLTGALTGTTAAFNSGGTNVVASFTSTDPTGVIQIVDNNGNVEIGASGNNFVVQPAGGVAQLTVGSSSSTFAGSVTAAGSIKTCVNVEGGQVGLLDNTCSTLRTYWAYDDTAKQSYFWNNEATAFTSFYTNSLERLRIDSSGNIQIPTDSAKIQFRSSGSSDYSSIFRDSSNVIQIANTAGTNIVSIDNGGDSTFAGNVGIGTDSPDAKLHLNKAIASGSDNLLLRLQNPTTATDARVGIAFAVNAQTGSDFDGSFIQAENDGIAQADLTFGKVFNNTLTKHMIIKGATGNVGIGTDSPTNGKVQIHTASAIAFSPTVFTSGANIRLQTGGTAAAGVTTGISMGVGGAAEAYIGAVQNASTYADIVFQTYHGAYGERMRINSSGFLNLSDGAVTLNKSDGTYIIFNYNGSTKGYIGSARQIITGETQANMAVASTGDWVFGTGSSLTERMRIASNGLITIDSSIVLDNNEGLFWESTSGTNEYFVSNGADLQFGTGGTERMRITSGGDLLVGKTSADFVTAGIELRSSGQLNVSVNADNFNFYNPTAGVYRFFVSGAGAIYATSTSINAISDVTLKENIKPLETGLNEVMKLQPRRFDWKNGDGKNIAGFVAQEVEEILPDLVSDYKYTDKETKKSLKMGDMIPTLVKAIQELTAKVEMLEKNCNCK